MLLLCAFVICGSQLTAQPPDETLHSYPPDVQIAFDRPLSEPFFTMELLWVSLTLTNKADRSIDIPNPDSLTSGGLAIQRRDSRSPNGFDSDHYPYFETGATLIKLPPAAQIKIERWADAPFSGMPPNALRWIRPAIVGYIPGVYSVLSIWSNPVDLRVVLPKVETWGDIVAGTSARPDGTRVPLYLRVLALSDPTGGASARHFIYVSDGLRADVEPPTGDLNRVFTKAGSLSFGSIVRVAATDLPIVAVSGSRQPGGGVSISYTTSDGVQRAVQLDATLRPTGKVTVPPYPPPTLGISPVLECVKNNGNGSFNARFGYLNRNSTVVTVPVGTNNRFSPDPQDRGQVAAFQPGRIVGAFEVTWPGSGNLVWTLKGPDNQNRTATASATSQACAP